MKLFVKILCSLFFFVSISVFSQNDNVEILDLKKEKSPLDTNQQIELSKKINEMKAKYEAEMKEKAIELLSKDKEIQMLELKKQATVRNYFAGGFFIAMIFLLVIYNKYRKEKKELERLKKDHDDNQKIIEKFSKT